MAKDYSFCKLEKDIKTYNILVLYTNDFKIDKNLAIEDNLLQCEEIKEHNMLCGKDECIEWIRDNAKKYRAYLNAIKILATIMYCSRAEVTWENFLYYIDRYNECETFFIERIYIND